MATRRQLERWEPLVAAHVRSQWGGSPFPSALVWEAATEHHFALIAARNLLRAIDLPGSGVSVDATTSAELIEGRDLHEHWVENLPIFNVHPRPGDPPRRSGQDFATRNPDAGPYWWFRWSSTEGPKLLPNVPTHAVHELLDRVETAVLRHPDMEQFIPPRQPSPWAGEAHGHDRWWPAPLSESE